VYIIQHHTLHELPYSVKLVQEVC